VKTVSDRVVRHSLA